MSVPLAVILYVLMPIINIMEIKGVGGRGEG